MDFNIMDIIITGLVIIISLTFHEYAHGLASYSLGDTTAKDHGRLTLNPISHIDPFGLIMLFVVKFGWAKPVPINPYMYKNRRVGTIITSFAGPFANLLLAFITCLVYTYLVFSDSSLLTHGSVAFFTTMVVINVNLAIFNLLPIPPLDGSKIFAELFGGKVAEFIYKIEGKGMIVIFLLLMLPPVNRFLSTQISKVIVLMMNISQSIIL